MVLVNTHTKSIVCRNSKNLVAGSVYYTDKKKQANFWYAHRGRHDLLVREQELEILKLAASI